ncbi:MULTISPECIES: hypothetical protein [unclassified Streptomyces]|uniref:hypothetical protein n=1 Tax=unclassified Streptomyces TaxID=2593676 RepID=UPI0035E2A3D2
MNADYYSALVAAAATAAGPCPNNGEAAWQRRVEQLAVELAFSARQVAQEMERLDSSAKFAAYLERVEVEETSRRGVLHLRTAGGESEHIRTEQEHTERGNEMLRRARELTGRWVLVYRYNERKAGSEKSSVRMVARLMDLGDGALSVQAAQSIVLEDAGGDREKAQQAWTAAGLRYDRAVPVSRLEEARAALRTGA